LKTLKMVVKMQKKKLKFRFLYTAIVLFVSVSLVYSHTPPKNKKPVQTKQIEKPTDTEEVSLEPSDTNSLSELPSTYKTRTDTEEVSLEPSDTNSLSELPSTYKTRYVPYEHSYDVEIKSRYFSVGYQITAPFSGIGGNICVGKIGEEGFFTGFDLGG